MRSDSVRALSSSFSLRLKDNLKVELKTGAVIASNCVCVLSSSFSTLLLVLLQEIVNLLAAVGGVLEEVEVLLLAVRPDYQTVE